MIASQIRNAAFAALEPRLHGLRLEVFAALQQHGPCTTRVLAERCGISLLTVRPRVNELVGLQLAACCGREHREGVYRALSFAEAQACRAAAQRPPEGVQTELALH